MRIEATPKQVETMAIYAILASQPAGLGFLYHKPELDEKSIQLNLETNPRGINIDYYFGRMVKFYARRNGDNTWEFDDTTRHEYQSWKSTYDSYQALFDYVVSLGVK